jgi:two-component system, OmpR family, sensor histidine kinase KdpD
MSTVARFAASLGAVSAVTGLYLWLASVNPTTVALSFLLTILIISTQWGIAEATAASVLATIAFNVFFLPPVGTLTIADPQNWVSFVAFMLTSIIASQLSGRARQRTLDATARQADLERLYAVSRALLLTDDRAGIQTGMQTGGIQTGIVRSLADAFELSAAALYDQQTGIITRAGQTELPAAIEETLRDVARQAVPVREDSGLVVTPLRLGGMPIGSLALLSAGAAFSDTVLQSLVNLVSIGLERARAKEASTRAEAARQSSELRATVLDAVAHELKTPLTSIKAAVTELASGAPASSTNVSRELISIIDEETNRLQALVRDAIQMLRIDTGDFAIHRERHRLAPLVTATINESGLRTEGHTVLNKVPADIIVDADEPLLRLALRQLLDNALKYSPPTSTIEIDVGVGGGAGDGVGVGGNGPDGAGRAVQIAVRNSGPAIPEHEQRRIFERFYRGAQSRQVPGTGMGLAIVQQIAHAHGGELAVSSAPGANTEFRLSLPNAEVSA